MRKEWINEGKPKETIENVSISATKDSTEVSKTFRPDEALGLSHPPERPQTPAADSQNDDDLYSATPRRPSIVHQQDPAPNDSLFISEDESGDQPPDDDLDILLAEDSMHDADVRPGAKKLPILNDDGGKRKDNFDDEMEAMAGMDDMW